MRIESLRLGWLLVLFIAASIVGLVACSRSPSDSSSGYQSATMQQTHFPEKWKVVNPVRCEACHAEEVEAWRKSQHAVANRGLVPETDKENFTHPVVDADLSPYQPVSNNSLRIEGLGAKDSPLGNAEGVIGVSPLIQYLISVGGGRFQAHQLAYDPHKEEWFDIFENDGRQPGEWGHWSSQGMNWNSNCAWCHMTSYEKNYDTKTDTYASTWVMQGISCLQCHSNSAAHTLAAEAGEYVSADGYENTPAIAMDNCASCHSRREELTLDGFKAGDSYHDHFRLTLPDSHDIYFADGQNRDENYVFGSLMLSKMGHAGVTCADCHDPHSQELILPAQNNALCQRCHSTGLKEAPIIDPVAHSHHPMGSTGNSCIECHMPHRTYMGRDPRRDHGFTSPDPELSALLGNPNACSQCHDDQSLEWATEHANRWYQSDKREQRRARAKLLARAHDLDQPYPTRELIVAVEESEETYWKATYLRLLSQAPEAPTLATWAATYAKDPHPIVRAAAVRLIGRARNGGQLSLPYLEDESRQVRIEVIDTLREQGSLPEQATEENHAYAMANSDRPGGAIYLAYQALQAGDSENARAHLRRAISFDRHNPMIYFQGALMLDGSGSVDQAMELLRGAPEAARQSGLIYYGEGLLWAEKGNFTQAASRLTLAVERDPSQARWWYNLALAYTKIPNWPSADHAIREGIKVTPQDPAMYQLFQTINQQLQAGYR